MKIINKKLQNAKQVRQLGYDKLYTCLKVQILWKRYKKHYGGTLDRIMNAHVKNRLSYSVSFMLNQQVAEAKNIVNIYLGFLFLNVIKFRRVDALVVNIQRKFQFKKI